MANAFYNRGASFNPDELADGDAIEAEFDSVSRGFDTIEDLVNLNKAGYPSQTFHVAPATETTHAVQKAQLDASVAGLNNSIAATNANLGTKLAAASYSASDVLAKLKTVDGNGSGVDADLLDGQDGSYYRSASNINAGTLAKERLPASIDANTAGNAATASKLLSALTLSLSGGASGSVLIDGSTNVTLNVTISSDSAEVGKVTAFARSSAPFGYLKCNGAAISRTTYATLFADIGTTFGVGDGSTTFNIPDLRGEFVRGWDDARGVDSGRTFGSWQDGQNESHTHTGTTSSESHAHTWSGTTSSNSHTHTVTSIGTSIAAAGAGVGAVTGGSTTRTTSSDEHTHTVSGTTSSNAHTHTMTTSASGGTEARVRNRALLYCIKY